MYIASHEGTDYNMLPTDKNKCLTHFHFFHPFLYDTAGRSTFDNLFKLIKPYQTYSEVEDGYESPE